MIMDASINVAMEPFRALVADLLPSDQRTLGFSVQTSLIGVGAVLGAILPYALTNWFGVSNVANPETGQLVAYNVKYAFYIELPSLRGACFGPSSKQKNIPQGRRKPVKQLFWQIGKDFCTSPKP